MSAGLPVWHFDKRWKQDDIQVGNATPPLAADWTAPNNFYWQMCDLDDLKIQNVILPDRYMEESGIYFVTPYDPEKIPVVFVHGLVSSPDAFKNMVNELTPEPWFRENYQIWLYNYPTGNPWIFSSMKFRELMNDACAYARTKGHDRNLNRMVVVAHSMGGLLTRSSVTDPKSVMYDALFNKPIDQLEVSAETRKLIRDGTLYRPLTEPERVVFLAVPAPRQSDGQPQGLHLDFPPHPPAENPDRGTAGHHAARRGRCGPGRGSRPNACPPPSTASLLTARRPLR